MAPTTRSTTSKTKTSNSASASTSSTKKTKKESMTLKDSCRKFIYRFDHLQTLIETQKEILNKLKENTEKINNEIENANLDLSFLSFRIENLDLENQEPVPMTDDDMIVTDLDSSSEVNDDNDKESLIIDPIDSETLFIKDGPSELEIFIEEDEDGCYFSAKETKDKNYEGNKDYVAIKYKLENSRTKISVEVDGGLTMFADRSIEESLELHKAKKAREKV